MHSIKLIKYRWANFLFWSFLFGRVGGLQTQSHLLILTRWVEQRSFRPLYIKHVRLRPSYLIRTFRWSERWLKYGLKYVPGSCICNRYTVWFIIIVTYGGFENNYSAFEILHNLKISTVAALWASALSRCKYELSVCVCWSQNSSTLWKVKTFWAELK